MIDPYTLLLLSCATAAASWATAREELFREVREWLRRIAATSAVPWPLRKLTYLPTCQVCLAFWFAASLVWLVGAEPFVVIWLATAWLAVAQMTLLQRLL